MAGVLEQIRRCGRRMVENSASESAIDVKAMQLRAAVEILAEIFDTDHSDIEDMIRGRLEAGCGSAKTGNVAEDGPWPLEFRLAD